MAKLPNEQRSYKATGFVVVARKKGLDRGLLVVAPEWSLIPQLWPVDK
jgi:hypothetical protein